MNPQPDQQPSTDEPATSPHPGAPTSIEETLFGAHWQRKTCSMKQAKEYFRARFGLGHTSFYVILRPRLRLRLLAPENLGRRSTGPVLFVDHVVEECNGLEERARAGTPRRYYRTDPWR